MLTFSAFGVVKAKKETRSAIADFFIRRFNKTELIAFAIAY